LFVCIYLCSVWPGVFLSRSVSRSFMYACGSDRITKHPERCAKATPGEHCSNYVRRTGEATPGERLQNSVRTTGNYSSSNEARRRASRTQSGGRVITASYYEKWSCSDAFYMLDLWLLDDLFLTSEQDLYCYANETQSRILYKKSAKVSCTNNFQTHMSVLLEERLLWHSATLRLVSSKIGLGFYRSLSAQQKWAL